MSKISVFKFNINGDEQTINIVKQIIDNYLNSRGFFYNSEKQCYIAGKPVKQDNIKNAVLSIGGSIAATAVTGRNIVISTNSIQRGFEYLFFGNQLIVKAYLINKNSKHFIHSTFNNSKAGADYYGDLQGSLFKELNKNNITLVSKEVEKINDGSEFKTIKILLIYFFVMILLFVGMIAIMQK